MTREQVLAHVAFMALWDQAYAAKSLKWYHGMMPWLGLMGAPDQAG